MYNANQKYSYVASNFLGNLHNTDNSLWSFEPETVYENNLSAMKIVSLQMSFKESALQVYFAAFRLKM